MVSIFSLWLPIILSAVVVFIVSSIVHMVFSYHKSDFKKLPDENRALNELGKLNIPQGDYAFPHSTDMKERKSQEFKDKMNKGPVGILTAFPSGETGMGSSLIQWFIYSVIVGIFAAYITGHALGAGMPYLSVFRYAGCTAFAGYSLALMTDSIWFKRSWSTTFKFMFDGLIYALFTAGVFGWLWPMS